MGFDNYIYVGIDSIITGQKIEQLRIQQGLTVEVFCEHLGISSTAYYKWIQGRSLPTLDHLVVLRRMCNISLDDIVISREDFDEER